jgi:hypothetical protein
MLMWSCLQVGGLMGGGGDEWAALQHLQTASHQPKHKIPHHVALLPTLCTCRAS